MSTSDPRVIVIGSGLSGILAAIELRKAGYEDVAIFEKADRVGGTWRENTYPGVACDVPSHLYSYSFALNPDWSRQFAPGHEIRAYIERVARELEVLPRIRFSQEVARCTWQQGRWQIETKAGARDACDVLIAATGITHHPRLPDIPGLSSFAGPCFHSARWDHDAVIDGQRVGIVGTGSSAVQLVAALTPRVAELVLFQRTAQWIMPGDNPAYDADSRELFRTQPQVMRSMRAEIARRFVENFSNAVVDVNSPELAAIERACLENLEQNVRDPVLREKLRPNYRAACKRLIISSDFYPALQQPHARLVTDGIECVEPRGVRTKDGRLHELDVLVLATGFQTDRYVRPTELVGRAGARLSERWAQRASAYLSIAVPGFPNFFMLNGPNGPVGNFSLIEVAEIQMKYILQLLSRMRAGECREISVTEQAAARYEAERIEACKQTVWTTGCRSWYLDDRGVPASWPWPFERFRTVMQAPQIEAYELAP